MVAKEAKVVAEVAKVVAEVVPGELPERLGEGKEGSRRGVPPPQPQFLPPPQPREPRGPRRGEKPSSRRSSRSRS